MKKRNTLTIAAATFALVAGAPALGLAQSGQAGQEHEGHAAQAQMPPKAAQAQGTQGEKLQVKKEGDISYVSGGVGDESQERMEKMSGDYNLKVTLAAPDGDYTGGANLTIRDQSGKEILQTETHGPLFLAKLPAGKYTVSAAEEGRESVKKTVQVSSAADPARVLFHMGKTGGGSSGASANR